MYTCTYVYKSCVHARSCTHLYKLMHGSVCDDSWSAHPGRCLQVLPQEQILCSPTAFWRCQSPPCATPVTLLSCCSQQLKPSSAPAPGTSFDLITLLNSCFILPPVLVGWCEISALTFSFFLFFPPAELICRSPMYH